MPVCPFGTHRLRLDAQGSCRQCGGALAAYVAIRELAPLFYNEARRAWDAGDLDAVQGWAEAAIQARDDLPEPHWLLGLVELRRGQTEQAIERLARARAHGACLDPEAHRGWRWVTRTASTTDGSEAESEEGWASARKSLDERFQEALARLDSAYQEALGRMEERLRALESVPSALSSEASLPTPSV